jgi:hypothetical protein
MSDKKDKSSGRTPQAGEATVSKKINEYRPVKVPKVRMGAADVLGIVYDKLSETQTQMKAIQEVVSVAAPTVSKAIEEATEKASSSLLLQSDKAGEALQRKVDYTSEDIKDQFKNFKNWCRRWFVWFVLACIVAVLSLVGMIYFGTRAYRDSGKAERLQIERDSIWRREKIYRQFADDNPKTFKKWLDAQR